MHPSGKLSRDETERGWPTISFGMLTIAADWSEFRLRLSSVSQLTAS
jgi:hypothetical protein